MNLRKLATRRLAGALGLLLALSLVLVFVPASVLAVPQGGHVFYGTVTTEGGEAAAGTVITASVDGLEYSTTVDAQGRYGYTPVFNIPADDPDTPAVEGAEAGDTIEFYVGVIKADLYDVDAEESPDSYPFAISGATELNLSIGEAPEAPLTAEAGGPYSGAVGESITLEGSASGGTSPYTYAWDLDNDGQYDDAFVASPSYSWEAAGTYTISLQVTDSVPDTDTDTATVTVTEEGAIDPWIYDNDPEDGVIGYDEALAAVNDYLAEPPIITKADALAVVILYFS